jgi:hypothetical protein
VLNLDKRLKDMERRTFGRNGMQQDAQIQALRQTIDALLAACAPHRGKALVELMARLDAESLTDADRLMLESLPPCYMPPADVVRLLVNVRDKY